MPPINRRQFVGVTGGATAWLSTQTLVRADEIQPPPQVTLPGTDIKLSRLIQGTGVRGGNRQSDQTRLGFDKLVALFRHAYARGITCFDLADLYGTHIYFREALRTIPRDQITILTKIWWRYDGPEDKTNAPQRRQAVRKTLERFRHELSTDTIDVVLLHCLTKGSWDQEMEPYLEELTRAKQTGQVRAVGVSCHDFQAMQTAMRSPWVDVVLARINPQGVKMDASPEEILALLKEMKAHGKAVLGMKIFGEGQLIDQKESCIRFAQEQGVLDAMTIGFDKPEQIDEVLQLMQKYPAVTA